MNLDDIEQATGTELVKTKDYLSWPRGNGLGRPAIDELLALILRLVEERDEAQFQSVTQSDKDRIAMLEDDLANYVDVICPYWYKRAEQAEAKLGNAESMMSRQLKQIQQAEAERGRRERVA